MEHLEFNTDSPLTGDESEDLLERREFCNRLADRIVLPKGSPGLVVSIEGPWGSGKTSAINMTAARLEKLPEPERPIIVHFNPWMIGSVNALAQEFFVQIASTIGLFSTEEVATKISKALLGYSQLFSFAKWIPGVGPWANICENFLKAGGKLASDAADLAKLNITEQKNQVSDAIKELGRPFVIFIDDLDRLPPEEVFTMIRLVKAISDFPQTAYVLALIPPILRSHLKQWVSVAAESI